MRVRRRAWGCWRHSCGVALDSPFDARLPLGEPEHFRAECIHCGLESLPVRIGRGLVIVDASIQSARDAPRHDPEREADCNPRPDNRADDAEERQGIHDASPGEGDSTSRLSPMGGGGARLQYDARHDARHKKGDSVTEVAPAPKTRPGARVGRIGHFAGDFRQLLDELGGLARPAGRVDHRCRDKRARGTGGSNRGCGARHGGRASIPCLEHAGGTDFARREYELAPHWRRHLGVGAAPALASDPLAPGEGLETDAWAHNEFAGAPLGDARLSARLVETAALMGDNPMASLPAAAKGDRAKVKGYYRFVDQPDEAAATPQNILRPHRERTLRRMRAEPTVLCIQDGTDLSFATRPGCEGLGVIGTNQTGTQSRGLHLHSTLAVTPSGLPLGVVNAKFVAPQPKAAERGQGHHNAAQQRKSTHWIEGFRDCAELARELRPATVVCVMDREADDFGLFEEQRARPQAELLMRVQGRRRVAGGRSLLDTLCAAPVRAPWSPSTA